MRRDFALVQGGEVAGATIASVTGSGTTWTVTANAGTGDGTLGLNLVDNDTIVETERNFPLGGVGARNGNFTGQVYAVVTPPVLAKTASNPSAALGSTVAFMITATNSSSKPLANVVMTDVLPTGLTYAIGAATLGSVAVNGQTVTWTVPQIPVGGAAQLTLAVTPSATGTYTNTVISPPATPASATLVVLPKAAVNYRMDENAGSWTGACETKSSTAGAAASMPCAWRRRHRRRPTRCCRVRRSPLRMRRWSAVFATPRALTARPSCRRPVTRRSTTRPSSRPRPGFIRRPIRRATTTPSFPNDVNYEFHLDPNGRLYWWWWYATLTSAKQIPLNQWTHVAIAFNSAAGRQIIYINGVPDTNTNSWVGTLQTNSCPIYVGGDIGTGNGVRADSRTGISTA